ncbi:hypothetical protein GCM10010232_50160 [Streptomyces amakusaensis]|uniref:Uncharacterized protein n=1 Tax=Streptomyces amakusaensis TaxID=67271 RepID=A0ABW0AM47_9ACTN
MLPLADRFLSLRRDPESGEVLACGGGPDAHGILERSGFVLVLRVHELYHRLPTGLDPGEETRLATRAVARLRSTGVPMECDAAFDTDAREIADLTLGTQVGNLAATIRRATTSDEVAETLAEVTAAYDGVLAGLADVLVATADFYQDLGGPADRPVAEHLRHLAVQRLGTVAADLRGIRTDLADRRTPHPRRSVCSGEVPQNEREASAVCACTPPPPPPAPPAARLR